MATRFFFSNSASSPQSVGFDSAWTTTNSVTKVGLVTSKDVNDLMVTGITQGWAAPNSMELDRQYISPQVDSQFINGTLQCYIQCREFATTDNVVTRFAARVITGSGTTRGTLMAAGKWGSDVELVNNATLRTAAVCSQSNMTSVTAGQGDRIVIEIGFSDLAGTTPQGAYRWGASSLTEAAVNETTTTSAVGWAEFSQNLVYFTPGVTATPVPLLRHMRGMFTN